MRRIAFSAARGRLLAAAFARAARGRGRRARRSSFPQRVDARLLPRRGRLVPRLRPREARRGNRWRRSGSSRTASRRSATSSTPCRGRSDYTPLGAVRMVTWKEGPTPPCARARGGAVGGGGAGRRRRPVQGDADRRRLPACSEGGATATRVAARARGSLAAGDGVAVFRSRAAADAVPCASRSRSLRLRPASCEARRPVSDAGEDARHPRSLARCRARRRPRAEQAMGGWVPRVRPQTSMRACGLRPRQPDRRS